MQHTSDFMFRLKKLIEQRRAFTGAKESNGLRLNEKEIVHMALYIPIREKAIFKIV